MRRALLCFLVLCLPYMASLQPRTIPRVPRERIALDVEIINNGAAALVQSRWTDAVRSMKSVLRLNQKSVDARFYLANALIGLNRTREAAAVYKRAYFVNAGNIKLLEENFMALQDRRPMRPNGRFLSFRYNAGLFNRRIQLMGMIGVAKLLNRTLILPSLIDGVEDAFEEYYNVSRLSSFVDVISEKQFRKFSLPLLSGHMLIRDYGYPGHLSHLGASWRSLSVYCPPHCQTPMEIDHLLSLLKNVDLPLVAIDFSYRVIDYGIQREYEWFDGVKDWLPERIPIHFSPSPLFDEVLAALRPSHNLLSLVDAAVTAHRPYVALHVRRNDMMHWTNRRHAWPSLSSLVEQTRLALRNTNSSSVFLMTDAAPDEVQELKRQLSGVWMFAAPKNWVDHRRGAHKERVVDVMCDVLIAAHGAQFIGNIWSTVSWAVIEERHALGTPLNTVQFQHAPRHNQGEAHE